VVDTPFGSPSDSLVCLQAGSYLTATRGLGASEARMCYERAEPLCRLLNRPLLLCVALKGQYSPHMDKLTATMQIAERIHSLAREQNNDALMVAANKGLIALFLRTTRENIVLSPLDVD
jgi:hypothetical protein